MKRNFASITLRHGAAALALAAGCSFKGGITTGLSEMGLNIGTQSQGELVESSMGLGERNYTSKVAARTNSIAVEYIAPPTDISYSIMDTDFMGNPKQVGSFYGAKTIADAFARVAKTNFAEPRVDIPSIAKFSVSIEKIAEKLISTGCSSSIEVKVRLSRSSTGEVAYEKTFSSRNTSSWTNSQYVPQSFYASVNDIVDRFLADWESSPGVAKLEEWAGVGASVIPPELQSLEFSQQDSVYFGRCIVSCNTYEAFRAKSWADTQIEVACRHKLGIEPERVRIVYDNEKYDPNAKTWTFEFRTFARSERVLSFNKATKHGMVTGDLGLMNLPADEAAAKLREFVLNEMNSHVGVVSSEAAASEAFVRFEDFTTDTAFNLITIKFRLVN